MLDGAGTDRRARSQHQKPTPNDSLTGKKRRRAEHRGRDAIASQSASSAVGIGAAALASGVAEVQRVHDLFKCTKMCEYLAACHLTGKLSSVYSSAFDAARIGQPALELLLHTCFSHTCCGSLVLPPAELAPPFSDVWVKQVADLG